MSHKGSNFPKAAVNFDINILSRYRFVIIQVAAHIAVALRWFFAPLLQQRRPTSRLLANSRQSRRHLMGFSSRATSLDLSMDGKGDNLGRWKGDILSLDRAQFKFPRLTLAQVLQKMALHDGTTVQGIQKRTQLFIQFVYSNCHVSLECWNNVGDFAPG